MVHKGLCACAWCSVCQSCHPAAQAAWPGGGAQPGRASAEAGSTFLPLAQKTCAENAIGNWQVCLVLGSARQTRTLQVVLATI